MAELTEEGGFHSNFYSPQIYSDNDGNYTNEPILAGLANHLQILSMNNEDIFNYADSPILTSGEQRANAEQIIKILMPRLGLTRAQAAGIAGVGLAESGCNPHSFNKAEKAGTYYRSAANGPGYGGGIWQWSLGRKAKALALIGKTGPIENTSLEDQCEMLARELEQQYKATLTGIKKCNSAPQAAATFYCHNIAGYSKSTEPATQAEIDRDNARYAKVGGNSQINKGMNYAAGLMTK